MMEMKILAFVDIHGSIRAVEAIKKRAGEADVVICAGDISIFEQNLNSLVSMLNGFGKPVLMIPGNHETEEEMKRVCSKFKNTIYIHKKGFVLMGYLFIGYGGGGFSQEDPDFENWSKKFLNKKNLILATHAPPYKTKLDMIKGKHYGNNSIRNFIIASGPLLAVCGHLHENSGKSDRIGKTKVINPGPQGMVITI